MTNTAVYSGTERRSSFALCILWTLFSLAANPSGTPITVKKPSLSGADAGDFAQTTTCPLSPATLAPGASCSVLVTFTPKATGARTATLKITDSVPGSPQLVGLGGMGLMNAVGDRSELKLN